MKRWLHAALLAGLVLAVGEAGAERIREFDALVSISEDGSFLVEERIRYDFENERRRGIYRDIPVRYGRGAAADYRIGFDVVAVTDEHGNERPYEVSGRGRDKRIRIGDPNRRVTGLHEYRIQYRVRRGILWLEEHDELYWNVTGSGWKVPIDRAEATVLVPGTAGEEGLDTLCFTGPHGSIERSCRKSSKDNAVFVQTNRGLAGGEGLTIVVALPKGMLREPSLWQRRLDRASDFVGVATVLPLALFLAMGSHWWRHGRDPSGPVSIPVRYEPPEGMRPAEMGTVLDEKADLADVTATILDLAVRGYLRIEEIETKRFVFLSETDYRLHRLHRDESGLKPYEATLLSSLFRVGGDEVDISDLKDSFYQRLAVIQGSLYKQVTKEGWFPAPPDAVRARYVMIVVAVAVLGTGAAFLLSNIPLLIAMIASGIVGVLWSRAMPRRTKKGRRARQHIEGFREFVERVEVDRLERMGMHTVEQFEKLLPYAFVFGAADAWADAFADLYVAPPDWYAGDHGGRFRSRHFIDRVGRSLSSVGDAMSSQPRSSGGGSGSSGFGSGGGFSGGGFGGGGGGSW